MKKFIRNLQEKPDHVKNRYVIFFAIIATASIVGIWVLVNQSVKKHDDTIKTQSPFSIFSEIFGTAMSDIKDQRQQTNPVENSETENGNESDLLESENNEVFSENFNQENVTSGTVQFSPSGSGMNSESASEGLPPSVLSE